jgi:hypothetical protein
MLKVAALDEKLNRSIVRCKVAPDGLLVSVALMDQHAPKHLSRNLMKFVNSPRSIQ